MNIGDIIIVKAGEKIPLDGVVVEGISSLNTSALTGESVPRGVKPGKEVISLSLIHISITSPARVISPTIRIL